MVKFRNFLGAVVLGLSLASESRADKEEYYSWISVADRKTTLDTKLASKARELAEMVMERSKILGVVSYEQNDGEGYKRAEVILNYKSRTYKITVNNYSEQEELENWNYDYIKIQFSDEEKRNLESMYMFIDEGLDGRCNFGYIPDKVGGITQDSKTVQKAYQQTLDDLTKFYSKKK